MITAEKLTASLGGQWSGSTGVARCPAHEDKNPSLSIGDGARGKVLLKCHAGCSQDSVITALKNKGLWQPTQRATVAARYDYHDEHCVVRYQVLRQNPKGFRQRQPDGRGGWIWKMAGVEPLPYKLPRLLRNRKNRVFIAEGEKDVDALCRLGLVATCNSGGAGKWSEEISRYLAGRHVVILPDNDEAGRLHAEDVARKLNGIAASTRVLNLPDLPEKGDVSDWIAEGGTREELLRLADEVPEWVRSAENDSDIGIGALDVGYDDAEIPPREWLLGNSVCRGFVSAITAPGGVGKTATAIAQALALATERELTGEHVFYPCRVLCLSLEDNENEIRRRLRAAMKHHGIGRDEVQGRLFVCAIGSQGWKVAVMSEDGRPEPSELADRLIKEIDRKHIDVVIIDPLIKAHELAENDNAAMDYLATILTVIASTMNVAIHVLHHTRKGPADPGNPDQARGASSLIAAVRLVYTLAPMAPEEAKKLGISEEDRRSLIRLDSAKVNLAPASGARWFRLVGVSLGNGTPLYPNGDTVQAVEQWLPPDIFGGAEEDTIDAILTEIDKGLLNGVLYSDHNRAGAREAWRVVQRWLPNKTEPQARQMVKAWVDNKVLERVTYRDPASRHERQGLKIKELLMREDAP